MTRIELQKRNLGMIDEWCKQNAIKGKEIFVRNVLHCNGRTYKACISERGFAICGDGRYSQWLGVRDGDNSLYGHTIGYEVIYNWQNIKNAILLEIAKQRDNDFVMEHFTV